jgi:Polyketide cyclase / dehydrase and lipid transport
MTDLDAADVAASVDIPADAEVVYRMITHLPTLAELAEETTSMQWLGGDAVVPGARFKGTNCHGTKTWSTTCTVTHAEPGQVFAFDVRSAVVPVAHWRYDIVAADGGCRVTERTWDRRPGWFRVPAGWATGVKDRKSANVVHIDRTLERLKAKAEAGH